MTDYRSKFGNSGPRISLTDSLRRDDLFDGSGNKIVQSISDNSYLNEAESERFVKSYIKQRTRYIPQLDYSDPGSFCFYGSAEKYYNDSIKRVYNTYPYDGSKAEKMEWSLTASYLDLYMLEHEYPKEKGHVVFSRGADTGGGTFYRTFEDTKYITFASGPHSGTIFNSSKGREGNLKIDGASGNTIEFWMKKSLASWQSAPKREVVFDISAAGLPGTTPPATGTNYGRMSVELQTPTTPSASPIMVVLRSGSTGTLVGGINAGLRLGSSNVTTASIGDGTWHHYAITTKTSGSNTIYKLYIDGTLDFETTAAYTIGAVNVPMTGAIGALCTYTSDAGAGAIGRGQLSASLDEVRFWKEARTEKQIGTNWYRPVHGGTDNDHTNANLGLYYKFNEGITGVQAYDEVILDYSGRINNGKVIGWDSNFRTGSSGIELSTNLPESSYTEPGDPIINSANSRVQATLTKLKNIGKSHDFQNPSSLVNTVPSYFMTEDKTGQMRELMQIISSTLDDLFLKIKFLPKIKDYNYQDFFNKTGVHKNADMNNFLLGCEGSYNNEFNGTKFKPWMSQVLEHFGMVTTEIFAKSELMETFLSHTEKVTFEQNFCRHY